MEIITSHINADFDSLASMVAAKKLYPEALIVFPGSQERKLRDFIEVFEPVAITRIRDIDSSTVTRLIIVDTKQPDRIGTLAGLLQRKDLTVHIYDHHPFVAGDIRGDLEKIEEVGATATIFTELLKARDLQPTPIEATILCLGIYEETGSLIFPTTTERDLLAVAYLLKKGANLNIVSTYLKMDLSRDELELLSELIQSSTEIVLKGIRIMLAKAVREYYIGDAAHLAHKIMDMEEIDAVVLLLNMEGKILIVARSRAPEFDVAELMQVFGGGGHPTAAAATIHEASTEIVADRIMAMLPLHVKPGKVASDVMTSPVITTAWDSSIREAADTMTRYGVNVLPILKDKQYAGLISRETVEKALFHGFRKNRCHEFLTSDATTVTIDTPVRDIETLMIEQNQRFMPVLRGDNIVGAITRTDLLRVLYEEFLRKRHLDKDDVTERSSAGRNLASWLQERFPQHVYQLLKTAGETADSMGFNAYLVGGSVRDLLLGHANLDIDIVVEGDGILFAKTLGGLLNAHVRPHERFGTAHLSMTGLKLDVATARTEYYESPAALPKVEMSSIKKDLYRRDFTINTLAIKLNSKNFGALTDFFGGQRDLREKTIRVLHNLSYVEDPTRAFRAIRFSERFGFKLSRHTEHLIKSAIQMDLFSRLSGHRLYEELMIAFRETTPIRTLKRLSDFGLLKVIHKDLVFDEKLDSAFSSVYETIAWYNLLYLDEKSDTGLLYLMTLLSSLDDAARAEAVERLSPPQRAGELTLKGALKASEILRALQCKDPAVCYHILKDAGLEIILFTMATSRDTNKKKQISHFLLEMQKVKPVLRGNDLKTMGIPEGPIYAKIFRVLLDEKLRGHLKNAEDEKKYVLAHFIKN